MMRLSQTWWPEFDSWEWHSRRTLTSYPPWCASVCTHIHTHNNLMCYNNVQCESIYRCRLCISYLSCFCDKDSEGRKGLFGLIYCRYDPSWQGMHDGRRGGRSHHIHRPEAERWMLVLRSLSSFSFTPEAQPMWGCCPQLRWIFSLQPNQSFIACLLHPRSCQVDNIKYHKPRPEGVQSHSSHV